MPNDDKQPKERSVRTRPANVIRAIVLSAAAAAAPTVMPGCESASDYGVPDTGDTVQQEDASGESATEDATAEDTNMDAVLPYGVPDGVDYGVPDGVGPDSVEYYGVPDGTEDMLPAYGVPDGVGPDSTEDYGVPDGGGEAAPAYAVPTDGGEPEMGLDYGVPKPPAK